MSILESERKETEGSSYCYVHIRNLPWTACQSDIKTFFSGQDIIEGGVLIHGAEAFVAFKDIASANEAMSKSCSFLHGSAVHLSIIDKMNLNKEVMRNVRRVLDFEQHKTCYVSAIQPPSVATKSRKIRPTRVQKGFKRLAQSCSIFCPDEIEFSTVAIHVNVRSSSIGSQHMIEPHCGRKKIHPTSAVEVDDWKRFPIFHPELSNEVKKK